MSSKPHSPTVTDLQSKLRRSRLLNVVLAFVLVFVGGAYASLVWGKDGGGSPNLVAVPPVESSVAETGSGAAGASDDSGSTDAAGQEAPRIETAPYMTLGAEDAPVVLFEWTDFTCPYCGLFHRDTLPTIIEEYVDTGKVRLEVHDVTFIGPQAEDAAVAARAAGLQDRYFDYLFAVYDLGRDGARPDLSRNTLEGLADDLGLDPARFAADFDDAQLRAQVQASTSFAQSAGISGVPFFVSAVGGSLANAEMIQGAQPIENVRAVLDAALERAGA